MGNVGSEPDIAPPAPPAEQEAAAGGNLVGDSNSNVKGSSPAGSTRALGDAPQESGNVKFAEPVSKGPSPGDTAGALGVAPQDSANDSFPPMFGSPAHDNVLGDVSQAPGDESVPPVAETPGADGAAPIAGGKGGKKGKGKKGKKDSAGDGEVRSMGNVGSEPDAAVPSDQAQDKITAEYPDANVKDPSPAGSTRALGDASQAPEDANFPPMLGSPAHDNVLSDAPQAPGGDSIPPVSETPASDGAAPVAGGKGSKGKKGKKGDEVNSIGKVGTEPDAEAPAEQEATANEIPPGFSDANGKSPLPASTTRALSDAPQAPGDNHVHPVLGSPAKDNAFSDAPQASGDDSAPPVAEIPAADGSAPVSGGNGGKGGKGSKGKKGKKDSSGDGETMSMGNVGTEPGSEDPVDKVQDVAAGGDPSTFGDASQAPDEAAAFEPGTKGPSPAGTTRALSDVPQTPGPASADPNSTDLPEAAQKVENVLNDATNGQHRRDPGIDSILDILSKAFPGEPSKEAAKEAPATGMSDAERGALEDKANTASKERDDAHSVGIFQREPFFLLTISQKLNEMLAVERALSEERNKNAEKEKAELQQKVKDAEAERSKLESQLGDVNKMRNEHHKLIADSLKQLTSFTTAEADRLKQASSKPTLQDIRDMIEHQNDENSKLLKVVASDIILHNTSQHRSTVGSVEKSNATAMKGNIDTAVDEFKKQLLPEVRGLVKEIGDLREQKRGLQHEISELFAIKSKQGNGAPPPPKVDYNPRAPPAKENNKKDDKPKDPAQPPPPAWLSWQPPVNFAPPPLPSQPR